MEDKEIIALYFARSENAIFETALKYGGYCGTIAEDDWRFIWDALVQTRFISEEDKMELGILSSND